MNIIIGTRGSRLALLQTNEIIDKLKQAYPWHTYQIKVISTHGDQNQRARLDQMHTSGIFIKEIEQQLLDHRIDLAIHSMKDLPARLANGLCLGDVMIREDSRDVLVLREANDLMDVKPHAIIATGSKRRKYQLLELRDDLEIVSIRGNIDTRLRKMEEEGLDGIVVAAAAMHRLGLQDRISAYFSELEMIPATTQGALAIELREEDEELMAMIHAVSNEMDTRETSIEREFLYLMNGGCHTPIGARCHIDRDMVYLLCVYGREDGSHLCKKLFQVPLEKEQELAMLAAQDMKKEDEADG